MKFYAGIGSRKTPLQIQSKMTEISRHLAQAKWTLRSGHAPGADQSFGEGALEKAQIFLPWPSFCSHVPLQAAYVYKKPSGESFQIASQFHPRWNNIPRSHQLLLARNVHQVLGYDLKSPSKFVICWTENGTITGQEKDSGGTGQAIRLAASYHIPVFNLQRKVHMQRVEKWLNIQNL